MAKKKAVRRRIRCAVGVCDPSRTDGLAAPAPKGEHSLVTLRGPGVFVAAHVSKQGGNTGLTFVDLTIETAPRHGALQICLPLSRK